MDSTAIIAKSNQDFTITAIHLTSGADLHYAGRILHKHYHTPAKINALITFATTSQPVAIARLAHPIENVRLVPGKHGAYRGDTGIDELYLSDWMGSLQPDVEYIHHEGQWMYCRKGIGVPLDYILQKVRYQDTSPCCETAINPAEHHIRHHIGNGDNVYLTCFSKGWTDQDTNLNLQTADLHGLTLTGTIWNYGKSKVECNHVGNANYSLASNSITAPEGTTSLRNANLRGTVLNCTDLRDCTLANANLTGAQLELTDLTGADLTGANLQGIRLGKAILGVPSVVYQAPQDSALPSTIHTMQDLLPLLAYIDANSRTAYYRGEPQIFPTVMPAIHRLEPVDSTSESSSESSALGELMRRQPEAFADRATSFDHLSIARHYGLPTRILDITTNPLVALWHATRPSKRHSDAKDGRMLIYLADKEVTIPFNHVKASILANYCKMPHNEQRILLGYHSYGPDYQSTLEKLATSVQHDIGVSQPPLIDPRTFWEIMIVKPRLHDERIKAQQAAFIACCEETDFSPADPAPDNAWPPLILAHQITVPEQDKGRIQADLAQVNISEETLYPSLETTARAIKREFFKAS